MTEKELRRMSRRALLELLIGQMEENRQLRTRLEQQEQIMAHSGTMAEAALKLSGIFEAADRAAAMYLKNAERKAQL